MFKQFTGVTGVKENRGRKIDIVDAISMAQRFFPSAPPTKSAKETEKGKGTREFAFSIIRGCLATLICHQQCWLVSGRGNSAELPNFPQAPEESKT